MSRVALPVMTSRQHIFWIAATGVAVTVLAAWVVLTSSPLEAALAALTTLAGAGVTGWWLSTRWHLDTGRGVLTRTRGRNHSKDYPLHPSTQVCLTDNGGGVLLLAIRPEGHRRRAFLPILTLTDYVTMSLPATHLRALADTLDKHRPDGARSAIRALRDQADAVEQGVPADRTPLAARIRGACDHNRAGTYLGPGTHLVS